MIGLDHSTFKSRIRKLIPNAKFYYGPSESSGIYAYLPKHPDSKESGLVQLTSYPSPRQFPRIPQKTFLTTKFLTSEGDPRPVRGWNSVINTMIGKKFITRFKAMKVFPGLMRPYGFKPEEAEVI